MRYTVKVEESGTIRWYKEGTTIEHRIGGPAFERFDGHKEWIVDGKHHRIGGYAIEFPDGTGEYFIHGVKYSTDKYFKKIEELKGMVKDLFANGPVPIDGTNYKLIEFKF